MRNGSAAWLSGVDVWPAADRVMSTVNENGSIERDVRTNLYSRGPECDRENVPARTCERFRRFRRGYRACERRGVLRYLCSRSLLILLPLAVCAGRLHGHTVTTPIGVTQELNCCLTMVRIAATRRSAPPQVRRVRAPRARSARYEIS